MIKATERNDLQPICPYCDAKVTELAYQEVKTILGKRFVYFCSNCTKALGVSHRKGFWMG